MVNANTSQVLLPKILLLCLLIFLFNHFCFAQDKVDLEIKTETSSKTVRGGEIFSVTVTVTNNGPQTAENVYYGLQMEQDSFISPAISNRGQCELLKEKRHIVCRIQNLKNGESAFVKAGIQVEDFGDISQLDPELSAKLTTLPESTRIMMSDLQRSLGKDDQSKEIYGRSFSGSDTIDTNLENDDGRFLVRAFPSKNIPPRIEIISPEYGAVIIKPVKEIFNLQIKVKIFDPDGKIESVTVPNKFPRHIYEDNQIKYIIGRKKYTEKEIQENYESFRGHFETVLNSSEQNIYTYSLKDFIYGENTIFISAKDNGGRQSFAQLRFSVKSDASIEILTPKNEQVFIPNSTITVETVSKVSDGIIPKVILRGTKEFYSDINPPTMNQTSKIGNIYKHQFVWKNIQEGIYDLHPVLFEDEQNTNIYDSHRIIIAEPRVIKITSLKNGQEFEQGNPIRVSVEATNAKGEIVHDGLELFVDGKSHGRIYNSWTTEPVPPYNKKILDKNIGLNLPYLDKGTHTIQIIAKQHEFTLNGAILGKSELITIKVK